MRTPQPQKVAIVTGASQGIGAGITAAFGRDGYAVVANSRSIRPSGEPDVVTVEGDIADADTAERVMETALDRFGRVDTLVNNAGIFIGKAFTDYTPADFDATTAVNLAGFFHVTQRAIALHPLGRAGEIDDVVDGILYLERATFVTGETLHIDGGQAAGH
jgi:NAD(P)-dependent dehydrogenase (short-subunit alcohol dehydrogenase family)